MKTLALVSRAVKMETANDRRLAIQNAWSIKEMAVRQQNAIDSQYRLARLLLIGQQKDLVVTKILDLAS